MPGRERPRAGRRVARAALALFRHGPMLGIAGDHRIVLARCRQQRDEDDHGDHRRGEDPVRAPELHAWPERSSVPFHASSTIWATCFTATEAGRPFRSWIMHAGQLVATTSAPVASTAPRLRAKICCDVS